MSEKTLKVLGLRAENILNLEFIEIATGGKSVTLVGPNGAGKTNVFNAILLGMGWKGKKDIPDPVRNGQESGDIELDLGDMVVRRHIAKNGSTILKVTNNEGMIFSSPQKLLNGFRQKISFDPQEFTDMPEKEQREILINLMDLPIDLDDENRKRKEIYDERTVIKRGIVQLTGQMEGIPDRLEVPDEEKSTIDIMDAQKAASAEIAENDKKRNTLSLLIESKEREDQKLSNLENEIIRLQEKVTSQKDIILHIGDTILEQNEIVESLIDPDLEKFKCEITDLEKINMFVREKKDRAKLQSLIDDEMAKRDRMTKAMTVIDEIKDQAVRNADMPVDGLGIDDIGITFENIPLKQRSTAEQIEVAVRISMELNKKLKVIWIQKASLLDDERMATIKAMAEKFGYQLWLERVEREGEGEIGVHISEGSVVKNNYKPGA